MAMMSTRARVSVDVMLRKISRSMLSEDMAMSNVPIQSPNFLISTVLVMKLLSFWKNLNGCPAYMGLVSEAMTSRPVTTWAKTMESS